MNVSAEKLTPIQINCIQVALDHLEEHLFDVISGAPNPQSTIDNLQFVAERLEKLIAIKQVKQMLEEAS